MRNLYQSLYAIKYSPRDSRILLSATLENVDVSIMVRDTGFNIPEEDMEEIFTRFCRVKNNDTPTIHGTGWGLQSLKALSLPTMAALRLGFFFHCRPSIFMIC